MQAQQEDQLHMLFPTVVQLSQLDDAQELNRALLQEIGELRRRLPNSKPRSWACDLYTTIGDPEALLRLPAVQRLLRIAQEKIRRYAQTYRYPLEDMAPQITECWANVYGPGQSQEAHLHKNCLFSGIYYLQAPPGSGATVFYSPACDVMLEPRPTEGNNINATVTGYPPVEGRMMIFRSSTRHSVLPGEFEGERITLSFNAVM
ncbi:MAG: hypothetical protein CME59_07405 [Halioglobus sp.]|nr:hypothetical protein [Halioglobus sp.]|tara:strand:- start:2802 stop:3413 length:612 start_codon:yes stop_codon:yes gene_type:complete